MIWEPAVSENKPKSQTHYLGQGSPAKPMPERGTSRGTNILSPAWLVVFQIGTQKVQLPIGETIIVGRAADESEREQIQFDLTPHDGFDHGVSRKHAEINLYDGSLYLRDLGSTNGTRINGFQLSPERRYRLREGDEVEFARLRTSVSFARRST
jgi:hypothetical protein